MEGLPHGGGGEFGTRRLMKRFIPYLLLAGALVLAVAAWIPIVLHAQREPRTFSAERAAAPPPALASSSRKVAKVRGDALAGEVKAVLTALVAKPNNRRAEHVRRLTLALEQEGRGTARSRRQAADAVVSLMREKIAAAEKSGWPMKDFDPRALEALALELASGMRRRLPTDGKDHGHKGNLLQAVKAEPPAGYTGVSFGTLGGFEYREGEPLPANVQALAGQPTAIAGYMISLGETDAVTEFLLVESLWDCCFGIPPDIHQGVVVTVPDGRSVPFTTQPIQVLGDLRVGEAFEDGEVISIYRMRTADVRKIRNFR